MLTTEEARAVYDRIGTIQDRQAFYEDAAVNEILAHGDFGAARAVVEFGSGTGRFARALLADHLPPEATWRGFDLSPKMVGLARERVAEFGSRAAVALTDGSPRLGLPDGCCDRFVTNYVLDLLPEDAIRAVIGEAARLLAPGGLLCVTGLTFGPTLISRASMSFWRAVHALAPRVVGGCRPVEVAAFLDPAAWRLVHHARVVAWTIPSEALVAARL